VLSQKSKYALKAAIALAREFGRGPVLISDIARREIIPRKFLEGTCKAAGVKVAVIFWRVNLYVSPWVRCSMWWRALWPLRRVLIKMLMCVVANALTKTAVGSGW
jgi:hypothetical protein